MLKLLTALAELTTLIFGRSIVASYLAQIRCWWLTYQDTELKKLCDAEYEKLQQETDQFRHDRDDA